MSDEPIPLAWVIFERANRSNSVIVVDPTFPNARRRGAVRLRLREEAADYAPVIDGESVKAAKERVAKEKS